MVRAGRAGRSVRLQYKSGSTWKTAASKATYSSGVASFSVTPTTAKTWRLSYAGNKTSLFYAPRATIGTQVKVS